jgi:hypothetical protein
MRDFGQDSRDSGQLTLTGLFENFNKHLASIKREKFLNQITN